VITYHSPWVGAMAGAGAYRADKRRMRYFFVVALIVLGVIFLKQKKAEDSAPQKPTEAVAQATLTPRPASEHDWAKAAIDRTNEVRQKVKRERASNEVP
jgi:uncharacterized membrane protein YfcA